MRLNPVFLGLAVVLAIGPRAGADDRIPINVLYAGNPGSDREKDFVGLLESHFARVEATDYRTFREEQAEDQDVVIFDWTEYCVRDKDGKVIREDRPPVPPLSREYDRPTILIGGNGVRVVRPLHLKIDWLCLCLDDVAHNVATDHEIFHSPLEVNPTFEDVPTPPFYPPLGSGKPMGRTIRAWRVQTKKYPEVDPGLVSEGYGFDDSPDAEIISSGLNHKSPTAVALGRQGNFFLWGFSASPKDMTPEGRLCFINTVCYIKKFDGQRPIVHVSENPFTRGRALMLAHLTRTLFDPDAFRRTFPKDAESDPAKIEKLRQLELSDFDQHFPKDVWRRGQDDPRTLAAWVEKNYDWLRPDPEHEWIIEIAVDEDAKSLGISNHDVRLLETCVRLLELNEQTDLARRLLTQYTDQTFEDASAWRDWLDAHRDRLFFSESGGYKFQAAPASLIPPKRFERTPLSVLALPTRRNPVVAEAECSPGRVRPGESLELVVRLRIAPGWHISAVEGSKGPEVPTRLALILPKGVEPDGEWTSPPPIPGPEGCLWYARTAEFRRQLRVLHDTAAGPLTVTCTLGYQACDAFSCREPAEVVIGANAAVVKN